MNIKVRKITGVELLREANSFTSGHESKMSLATAYRMRHTTIRTQIFVIEMRGIPLFVGSQFVRHHVGVEKWMLTKRTDRGAPDFNQVCRDLGFGIRTEFIGKEDSPAKELSGEYCKWADAVEALPSQFDRFAPTDLLMIVNAEEIMNISVKRLCSTASKEARAIWRQTLDLIEEIDPDLVKFCKKPCVLQGYCRESKPCGYMASDAYIFERKIFKSLFKPKE